MKTLFTLFFVLLLGHNPATAQNQDLPAPTANLRTLPAGSYVIPMDNTLQLNSSGRFNLKAYGLIVYLLNNGVRVKWVIRSGKAKDGIDFSVNAEPIKPTPTAVSALRNFKGGPFVIETVDIAGVTTLIDAYYTNKALTGANRPAVYRTNGDVTVDVRYDLTSYIVKSAILNDGGNESIHIAYMVAAGIMVNNYSISNGTNLTNGCFTFASEPHNSATGAAVDAAITGIKNFVNMGGNFLAQCAAVTTYENSPLGRFHTSTGITVMNAGIGTTLVYANPDLSYSQIDGVYDGDIGGAVTNWRINVAAINNHHNHAAGTGSNLDKIGASAAKFGTGLGGMVYYLGNHRFDDNSIAETNGIRMYMNAMLTPAKYNCPVTVLPLELTKFAAHRVHGATELTWTVASNEQVSRFEIQRSFDGRNFSFITGIPANFTINAESYSIRDDQFPATVYYRIKITDRAGKANYSPVLSIKNRHDEALQELTIINHPVQGNNLTFTYNSQQSETVLIQLFTNGGAMVYQARQYCSKGINQFSMPAHATTTSGGYILKVQQTTGRSFTARAVK